MKQVFYFKNQRCMNIYKSKTNYLNKKIKINQFFFSNILFKKDYLRE